MLEDLDLVNTLPSPRAMIVLIGVSRHLYAHIP